MNDVITESNSKEYLVKEIPFDLTNLKKEEIKLGYLRLEPESIIIKKDNRCYLINKVVGQFQQNKTTEINETDFLDKLDRLVTKSITMTRYSFRLYDMPAVRLDIYHGNLEGLKKIKVSFVGKEQMKKFENNIPDWFGEEITVKEKYKTKELTKTGFNKYY